MAWTHGLDHGLAHDMPQLPALVRDNQSLAVTLIDEDTRTSRLANPRALKHQALQQPGFCDILGNAAKRCQALITSLKLWGKSKNKILYHI